MAKSTLKSPRGKVLSEYPELLIVPPLVQPHKSTFILLHGRGSNAKKFGAELLQTEVGCSASASKSTPSDEERCSDQGKKTSPTNEAVMETMQTILPYTKFVFPTASIRRAYLYKRSAIHQWFDSWELPSFSSPTWPGEPNSDSDRDRVWHGLEKGKELQLEGLQESTQFLHKVVDEEIVQLDGKAENLILGGLSQGCAAALIALMLWEGEKLGAFIGMCGYLPLCGFLHQTATVTIAEVNNSQSEDVFASESEDILSREAEGEEANEDSTTVNQADPAHLALCELREMIDLPLNSTRSNSQGLNAPKDKFAETPVFWGHGILDEKVNVRLGRAAMECMKALGVRVEAKEYGDLGHWYSSEMLEDIAVFLKAQLADQ